MGKKMNPNSIKALEESREKTQFNGERAVDAGKKSAELRKEYQSLQSRARANVSPEDWDEIIGNLKGQAKNGSLKAMELLSVFCGEKPKDQVELTGVQDLKVNIAIRD